MWQWPCCVRFILGKCRDNPTRMRVRFSTRLFTTTGPRITVHDSPHLALPTCYCEPPSTNPDDGTLARHRQHWQLHPIPPDMTLTTAMLSYSYTVSLFVFCTLVLCHSTDYFSLAISHHLIVQCSLEIWIKGFCLYFTTRHSRQVYTSLWQLYVIL